MLIFLKQEKYLQLAVMDTDCVTLATEQLSDLIWLLSATDEIS